MKSVGVAQRQLFGAQFARLGPPGCSIFKVQKSSYISTFAVTEFKQKVAKTGQF
jgi:hypothetical protein